MRDRKNDREKRRGLKKMSEETKPKKCIYAYCFDCKWDLGIQFNDDNRTFIIFCNDILLHQLELNHKVNVI